jgi:hypothetical protein
MPRVPQSLGFINTDDDMKKFYLIILLSAIGLSAAAQKWAYRAGNGVPGTVYMTEISENTYIYGRAYPS